jgi:hypothetical protein
MAPAIRGMGIPWYRREDYPRVLDIMADRDSLPPTFEVWRKLAGQVESDAKRRGLVVVRAVIDPDTFVAWCRARSLNVDANARVRFGNEAVAAAVKDTH